MKRTFLSLLAAAAILWVPAALAQQPEPQGGPSLGASTRLAALVPTGMSIQSACTGFRNLGDCSTALHVSQNLNIPFAALKEKVAAGESIDAAIHALKPWANAKAEAARAQQQARADLAAPQG